MATIKLFPLLFLPTITAATLNATFSEAHTVAAPGAQLKSVRVHGSYAYYFRYHGMGKVHTTTGAITEPIVGSTSSSGGADGTLLNSRFAWPNLFAFDPASTASSPVFYVIPYSNRKMRKIDINNNQVTSIAGFSGANAIVDGPYATAKFHNPQSFDCMPTTPLACYGVNGNIVRQITGGFVTSLGSGNVGEMDGPVSSATFNAITALTVQTNKVWVGDSTGCKIRSIDLTTQQTNTLSGNYGCGISDGPAFQARFQDIRAFLISGDTLYFSDDGRVRGVDINSNPTWSLTNGIPANSAGGYIRRARVAPKYTVVEDCRDYCMQDPNAFYAFKVGTNACWCYSTDLSHSIYIGASNVYASDPFRMVGQTPHGVGLNAYARSLGTGVFTVAGSGTRAVVDGLSAVATFQENILGLGRGPEERGYDTIFVADTGSGYANGHLRWIRPSASAPDLAGLNADNYFEVPDTCISHPSRSRPMCN